MPSPRFDREIAHAQAAVTAAPLRAFAAPHIIVDDVFPESLVAEINEHWPEPDCFAREVPGNHIFQIYRREYDRMTGPSRQFWEAFNELLWPALVSGAAAAFAVPATEVFGRLFPRHFSLDHPLTLMQADPSYPGHSMHQHFYHAPHWVFTMLLYIDPEDTCSRGTALHRLMSPDGSAAGESSYQREDLDWRVEVAMDTFHWLDPHKPDRRYTDFTCDYRSNRLFIFLDGPLALHSVPFDNPDHSPNPERARESGRHARRRILRSHAKIHHDPFYRKHSSLLPEPIEPVSFMRLMAPSAVLNEDDRRYRDKVLRPFFAERLEAYARAAGRLAPASTRTDAGGLWRRLIRRSRPTSETLLSQLRRRIP